MPKKRKTTKTTLAVPAGGPFVPVSPASAAPTSLAPHAFYANGIRMRTTPWDMTLHFYRERPVGARYGLPGDADPSIAESLCDVSLSPTMAKVLVAMLGNQVLQYEAQFGSIPMPKKREPGK